jgi:hypothetical protein
MCAVQRPFDEIEDGFGLRQLRQGCYCRMWDDMAKDIKLRQQMPLVAAHTLLVTGCARPSLPTRTPRRRVREVVLIVRRA